MKKTKKLMFSKSTVVGLSTALGISATTAIVVPTVMATTKKGGGDTPSPATTFTVTFDSAGGSEIENQTVESGKQAIKPEQPSKKDYVFKSWQKDGQDFDFSTPITSNITLVATWEPGSVTTFDAEIEIEGVKWFTTLGQLCPASQYSSDPIMLFRVGSDKKLITKSMDTSNFNYEIKLNNTITSIPDNFLYNFSTFNKPITIPSSVTSIGNGFLSEATSFEQTITFGTTNTNSRLTSIGNSFLYNCRKFNKPIAIPSSVTTIGNQFLGYCEEFNQELTIPTSVVSIGDNFLSYCYKFNNGSDGATEKPFTIPNSVTSIGISFMGFCYVFNQTLTLPANINKIESNFLEYCQKFNKPIAIPSNLVTIGPYFLMNCCEFNQPITIPGTVASVGDKFLLTCDKFDSKITIGTNSQLKDFGGLSKFLNKLDLSKSGIKQEGGLIYNPNTKAILGVTDEFNGTIPEGCESIGACFLKESTTFNKPITIPSSVKSIGASFLDGCTSFNSTITFKPNSQLTSIEPYFLSYCSIFNQSLEIPNGVSKIGDCFLQGCTNFNSPLTIPSSVEDINDGFLKSCTSFASTITIGANSQLKEFAGFPAVAAKTFVLTGSGITFNNGLMYNSNTKASLGATDNFNGTITDGCETISSYFLSECFNFQGTITFPETVTNVGSNFLAFISTYQASNTYTLDLSKLEPENVTWDKTNLLKQVYAQPITFKIKTGTTAAWTDKLGSGWNWVFEEV